MVSLHFQFNASTGRNEPVSVPKVVALPPKRLDVEALRCSCLQVDCCSSPSKSTRGFLCGTGYSHRDRLAGCVWYVRLSRGLKAGRRGGKPL